MPFDTTPVGFQPSGYRLRRRHEKSRNGCLRCKQQRKKCDELRPSCSRCTNRAYTCRYPSSASDGNLWEEEEILNDLPVSDSHVAPLSLSIVASRPTSPCGLPSDHPSTPSPLSNGQSTSPSGSSADQERLEFHSRTPGTLDATELGLLAHFLTHTSQTIPIDDLDLYALSVGVPNLAFKCNYVMSSLLALAAACKSHDISKGAPSPLEDEDLVEIRALLALAESHHRASLRHIQESIQNPDSYDYLLANAALMVLYASASHSVRVRLASTARKYGRRLPSEMLPQHSQWISFTRAAHIASTAVLNDMADETDGVPTANPDIGAQLKSFRTTTDELSPEDGPSEKTKRLFIPLVASTYARALESLRKRAEYTATVVKKLELSAENHMQLHASLETISILEKCASAALSPREGNESVSLTRDSSILFDEVSKVSSWVARYMISVTSIRAPQVLRRIIMSFLNKAPVEYFNVVQSVLDSLYAAENARTQNSRGTELASLNATEVLAMDIFAHWLVLVMLLDGVWWIGDIGQWELSQLVSSIKSQALLSPLADTGGTWWPESMYLVKRELSPNV